LTQEIHRDQLQIISNTFSVKRKLQNKENSYTWQGAVGVAHLGN
jgi:hypothetical protein